jgi:hypothetical protein
MHRRAFLMPAFACAMFALGTVRAEAKPRFRTGANGAGGELRSHELQQSLFKVSRIKLTEFPPVPSAELSSVQLPLPSSSPRRRILPKVPPAEVRPPALASSGQAARELALQPTAFTPYDRYLGTVRTVIANLPERDADMLVACSLMREGRSFRYVATDPYRAVPPQVTEARRSGDCKAKALWLYEQLGDPRALYVIGKLERRSKTSHAWVYWRAEDRWWILDPTDRADPVAADSVASSRYVPYYSFGKGGAFRHRATSLLLAGASPTATAPVATMRTHPVQRTKIRSGKRKRG